MASTVRGKSGMPAITTPCRKACHSLLYSALYLAEKAAKWGELPLHEWLRAVVKDPAQIAQLDELLGANP